MNSFVNVGPNYPQNIFGCGVDATSPSPLKNRKRGAAVRTPWSNNIIIDNALPVRVEKKSYLISSIQTLRRNFTGSLDLTAIATPLALCIEGEYARDVAEELTSICKQCCCCFVAVVLLLLFCCCCFVAVVLLLLFCLLFCCCCFVAVVLLLLFCCCCFAAVVLLLF